jgi:ureidoacrylate peracid hydrolase
MHKIVIPQAVIDRVIRHRGKEHVYENLDPRRTALLVVDMQNAFMMPGVAHAYCQHAESIVPNVNRLAQAMRETGATVVWIKTTFGDPSLVTWPVLHDMAGPERTQRRIAALADGSKGQEFWAGLDLRPQDLIVNKNRYSAFIQGSSNVAEVLRSRGIDTLVVTGTVTNVCCESTARDAMMMNFKTIMVTDANAGHTDEEHNASLIAFYLSFGDIMSTDELIACLRRNAKAGRTAPVGESA